MRVLVAVLLMSTLAEAAPALQFVRHPVAPTSSAAHANSRTIYLNRNGGVLEPGFNNSRTDTSSIVNSPVNLPGWSTDATTWAATVACMQEIWAPFGVEITEDDPGQVQHIEARFGGLPGTLGLPSNVGGIAPMATDCSVVENAIVFAFPAKLGNDPRIVCEVMSQEIGHSYGLDHELEASDPMTYLPYHGHRSFQDHAASCGESIARPCGIGGTVCRATQNSFQILLDRLGPSGTDRIAPTIQLVAPQVNATVEPGFVVTVIASDNVGVTSLSLYVDGDLVASQAAPPTFTTDPALAAGGHALIVEAIDAAGNSSMVEVGIEIAAADGNDDPDVDGPNEASAPTMGCSAGDGGQFPVLVVALLVLRRRRSSMFAE